MITHGVLLFLLEFSLLFGLSHVLTPLSNPLSPLGMRQIHLTVLCLYKVNTVRQDRPLLTHALVGINDLNLGREELWKARSGQLAIASWLN